MCGEEFIAKRRIKQTCSTKCFHKLLSEGKMGDKNPRFNDGRGQYIKYKPFLLKCEVCCEQKTLEVHHVDGNNRNNDFRNLLRVCRFCHMKLDGRFSNLSHNNSSTGLCSSGGGEADGDR